MTTDQLESSLSKLKNRENDNSNNKTVMDQTEKIYKCTFKNCDKVYRKLCRLEEHQRIHTGEVYIHYCDHSFFLFF